MNLRQNGGLNTRLVMRQKGRQETSGKESHGLWRPLTTALMGTTDTAWRDLKEDLAMIIFKRLYNTDEVRKPGFQMRHYIHQLHGR